MMRARRLLRHSIALPGARVAVPAGTVTTPVLVRSRPAASSQAGPTPTVDEGLNFPAVREVVPVERSTGHHLPLIMER